MTELLHQIDTHLDFLMYTRSFTPYMSKEPIGKKNFRTAPFYSSKGYDLHFEFPEPVTKKDLTKIRSIGHWINQNYIVRLYSLLDAHNLVNPINDELRGHNEVDILRRLRNEFSHSTGRYNPNDPEELKLYKRIVSHFGIEANDPTQANDYPISINTVLVPITRACKKYTRDFYERGGV